MQPTASPARSAPLSAAAATLDAELAQAAIDERLALILRVRARRRHRAGGILLRRRGSGKGGP
jgi:hypothetical protein